MNDPVLVSVLMTAYNREKYIADAIESVLSSTYTNFELIIVDDRSKDNTFEIAKNYELRDKRVKAYTNEKNLTDYPNRNKAASYANGKYLKYIDSDDILYPYGLEMIVSRMEANPTAAVGFAKRGLKAKPYPMLLSPHESYYMHFIENVSIFGNAPTSAIINRDKFIEAGGFSGLNQYGDYEFWLKIAAMFPILLVEGDITWDRDHEASEKYKDDIYAKSRLYHNITKRCLENEKNPLSERERRMAVKKNKTYYKKLILRSLLKGKVSDTFLLLKSL